MLSDIGNKIQVVIKQLSEIIKPLETRSRAKCDIPFYRYLGERALYDRFLARKQYFFGNIFKNNNVLAKRTSQ